MTKQAFTAFGSALRESLSAARSQFTAFAAGMNAATAQAAAAQQARREATQLGLASEKAEMIIQKHLERSRTTPYPIDWVAVRADMVEAATGFPYRDGRVVLPKAGEENR